MCTRKHAKYFIAVIILVVFHLLIQLALFNELFHYDSSHNKTNIIIWWTPFIDAPRMRRCGEVTCFFTANRSYFGDSKAILFYGSSFNASDLPLPRSEKIWSLFHEESPRNTPVLNHEAALSLFNFSSTFSGKSDLPLTLQYLPSLEDITSTKYLKSFEEKSFFNVSPVVYIQSDCSTPNDRDSYVAELMKYIKVDSYGRCLNNKNLPENLEDPMKSLMSAEMFEFISRYKFVISFENGICDDYITEKLWRPIIAGSLPIYSGSPSVEKWLPNEKTVLLVSEYSVENLVREIQRLSSDRIAYDEYFEHKRGKITNKNLKNNFRKLWPEEGLGVVEDFECLVCRNLRETKIVTKDHYDCAEPFSILDGKKNFSNYWLQVHDSAKCEAEQLREFVRKSKNYETFNFQRNKCDVK